MRDSRRAEREIDPVKSRTAVRKSHYKNMHGITPAERKQELEKRDHCCDLCSRQKTEGKSLSLDHDHSCCGGRKSCKNCQRGYLCDACNMALGLLKDDVELLKKAIKYVQYWKGRRVRSS